MPDHATPPPGSSRCKHRGALQPLSPRALTALRHYMYRHLPADRELRFRANLLLGILLTICIIGLCVILYFGLVAELQMESATRLWALQLISISELVYVALAIVLLRGHFYLATAGTVMVALLSVGAAVFFTGGAPDSPALQLLLLPAVIAYCLLGMRVGSIITALIPLAIAIQWYLSAQWGWQLPQLRSYKNPIMDMVLINSVNYAMTIMVLLVYERINANLRAERDMERQRLAHHATHDELTNVANRRHFRERLEEAGARCDRGQHQIAVLYIDLNGFKRINDEWGHDAGDCTLVITAQRLKATLRRQDFVARLGGDEFAIIIEPFTTNPEVEELCERLRNAIAAPLPFDDGRCRLGASIGVARYPGEVSRIDHVLRHADTAMYAAKRRHNAALHN